jgi:hypothetical protein
MSKLDIERHAKECMLKYVVRVLVLRLNVPRPLAAVPKKPDTCQYHYIDMPPWMNRACVRASYQAREGSYEVCPEVESALTYPSVVAGCSGRTC